MRVCVVTPGWGFADEQVGLLRREHDVRVVEVNRVHGPRWLVAADALLQGGWSQLWRGWKPEVVHSYSAWPAGIVGAGIAHSYAVPHIVHEHLSPAERLLTLPLVRDVLEQCDRIVVPSEWQQEKVERIVRRGCCVLPNPIVLDITQYWLRIHFQSKKVLCLGRLEEQKGFDRAIRAMRHVLNNYTLHIIGEGSQRNALKKLAHAEHVEHRVHFLPPVPRRHVYSLIKAHDVVVCPSRDESFGLVAGEAWLASRPVVATDVGAHRTFASHIVPNNEYVPALAEGIESACNYYVHMVPTAYIDDAVFVQRMTSIYNLPPLAERH
jgi:glycosyltransferase involved in cell wall biosynthesis